GTVPVCALAARGWGGAVIGCGGGLLVVVAPQVAAQRVDGDLGLPSAARPVPGDALESRRVPGAVRQRWLPRVGAVLTGCRVAKIAATVVETVAVDVVGLPAGRRLRGEPVTKR